MAKPQRTRKRASSRARTPRPHCKKKLHGEKGLEQHLKEVHRV
jgi:hypothetical protein